MLYIKVFFRHDFFTLLNGSRGALTPMTEPFVCLPPVQVEGITCSSAARAAASLSSRMNVLGRAARRNFAHGCGMPLFRHCETDPGVMPQRLATFPVPPSASMIVLASMFAII